MPSFSSMEPQALAQETREQRDRCDAFRAMALSLNMARGKPCKDQLDAVAGLLDALPASDYRDETGFDLRNYGLVEGIPEARRLFGALLGVPMDQVLAMGNSSLNLMFDVMVRCLHLRLPGSERPWKEEPVLRFLCPVPGYDRHFAITKEFGFDMIPVEMTPEGPDMDAVERLAGSDPAVKGIWCIPVYSNPDGITYSEETCRRLAAMRTAAPDFRIFWDNAYFLHHLDPSNPDRVPDILSLCSEQGHPDRPYEFASTSKITFAGGGIACVAASPGNVAMLKRSFGIQTIGPDKLNQLRHVRFLLNPERVAEIMARHAAILRPKFDTVLSILDQELGDSGVARWNRPRGGYFISLFVGDGLASRVVAMAKELGVEFTPAGATYPNGRDPRDHNIRIAPSFPPIAELETAIRVLCACIRLATAEKLLSDRSAS